MTHQGTTTEAAPTTTIEPRIYVASLSDYNAGRLLGRWIDADQDAEQIHAEIRAMLAESREPPAEEWAIHDYEGFGSWEPREYESIDTVATVAGLIAEHGAMFGAVLSYFGDVQTATTAIEDQYRGEWDSVQAYVEEFIDDVYGRELKTLPDIIRCHIDYEGIARDFEISGDLITIECDGVIHIFDAYN